MAGNVTLRQIADALGVSVMTVSRVVNNKPNVDAGTRKRVLEKAKSLGYTPNHVAKSLVSKRTQTIGVILPEIHHAFFSEVVSGIEEVMYKKDYQLFLTNSAESAARERKAIEALRAKRVDGILLSCAQERSDRGYFEELVQSGLPIVFFDRCIHGIGASCIGVDDCGSSELATGHLISNGYKRIAHLAGPAHISIGRKRLDGFKTALQRNKLPVYDELIVESGFSETGGYKAMQRLLTADNKIKPDSVVAVNDPVAIGALKAIDEYNLRVPEDIAIVGFSDDIRSVLVSPPLTTIRQPAVKIGKTAAETLLKHIEEETRVAEEIHIPTELIVRSSCGSKR